MKKIYTLLLFFLSFTGHLAGQTLPSPQLIAPANGSKGINFIVDFSWNSVANTALYQFILSRDKNISTLNVDTLVSNGTVTIFNLAQNAEYFWMVRAIGTNEKSAWSEIHTFRTHQFRQIPDIPVLFFPENDVKDLPRKFMLKWKYSPRVENYRVQISQEENFSSNLLDTAISSDSLFTPELELEKKYFWRIMAQNSLGPSKWSDIWSFATKEKFPKPKIAELIAPEKGSKSPLKACSLNWFAVSDAEKYRVQLSSKDDFSEILLDTAIFFTWYQLENLEAGKNYFWRINALNAEKESGWSEVWDFAIENVISGVDHNAEERFSFIFSADFIRNELQVKFSLVENSFVAFEIYDISGKKIYSIAEKEFPAGENIFALDIRKILPEQSFAGFLMMRTRENFCSRKILLLQ